jgi:hypothetical protein
MLLLLPFWLSSRRDLLLLLLLPLLLPLPMPLPLLLLLLLPLPLPSLLFLRVPLLLPLPFFGQFQNEIVIPSAARNLLLARAAHHFALA